MTIKYIDNLSEIQLSGGSIVLFADDLLLYHLITCLEDFEHLQNDVDKLCNWLSFHKLALNPNKCKSLLISRKRPPTALPSVYVNGSVLESVSSYRYLGVLISSDLSWSNHVKDISLKARKQVGLLYHRFYKHASPATLRTLYMALIRPHLEYAVPVWDPHLCKDINALESVQRFATKICTKSWNTSYQDLLDELHLHTLHMSRSYFKQCHSYRLVYGLSFFLILLSPLLPLTRIKLTLTIICPYMYLTLIQTLIIILSFVMLYVPGTHFLFLLHHHLPSTCLKRLCSVIYSCYCAHDTSFLISGYILSLALFVTTYVSFTFWHKLSFFLNGFTAAEKSW